MHSLLKPSTVYYIYRAGFAFFFAFVTTIFSIYHIEMVQLNPFQLVIIGTILELTCFIFEVPTGIVADHHSRKLSIIIGLIIMGIGLFIEGFFPVFIIVALAQVIWGFGATFLSGADIAWISDESEKKNIDSILLKATQINQLFIILGILLSIKLATIKTNIPILVSGAGFVALGLFLFIIMPETKFIKQKNPGRIKDYFSTLSKGFGLVRNNKLMLILFIAILLGGLFNEGWDRLWTYKFLKDLHLPTIKEINPLYWFALINIIAAGINFFVIHILKKKIDNASVKAVLIVQAILNFALSSSIVFFALTSNYYLALASYWGIYTFRNTSAPINDILINKNIEDSGVRATIFSMKGQMDQVGQMIGGPIIGFLAFKYSVSTGLTIVGLAIIPIVLIYLFLRKDV